MINRGEGDNCYSADKSSFILELDPMVYRLAAIKKAAYKFGDRCYIQITADEASKVQVEFKVKQKNTDVETIVGEFSNEVLDQELREVVAEETKVLRDLLLAQAFSATSLVDAAGDDADYVSDPKKISQSKND